MSEQLPEGPDEGHPIVAGLVALVGVGLAVGVIIGLVVLAGTQVLGLGEDDGGGGATSERSMYLPRPQKTPQASGPEITLAPGASSPAATEKPS